MKNVDLTHAYESGSVSSSNRSFRQRKLILPNTKCSIRRSSGPLIGLLFNAACCSVFFKSWTGQNSLCYTVIKLHGTYLNGTFHQHPIFGRKVYFAVLFQYRRVYLLSKDCGFTSFFTVQGCLNDMRNLIQFIEYGVHCITV